MRRSSLLSLFACLLVSLPVCAQDRTPLPSTPVLLPPPPDAMSVEQRADLDAWVAAMRKWQRMDRRWHNEPAHDAFGRIVAREPKPAPPDWLADRCAALGEGVKTSPGALSVGCRILAELREDVPAQEMRTATEASRVARERVEKNTFLTRFHIDGLWTSTASDVRLYGLVGSHISLVDAGRVQFFGPPGVILLSVPDASGERHVRAGYTWGMSVRLGDVRLFAPSKNMTLFLTISKVWVPGGTAYDRLQPGGFDIAGFSLAPRKHRKS
jgi:hypothetical protein